MDIASYIDRLTLSSGVDSLGGFLGGANEGNRPVEISPDLRAAVNVGSILSFVDGIDGEEKSDVLFSVQLAQRGASGAHNRFTETRAWYRKFLEILENVGWVGEDFAFARYEHGSSSVRMDAAALEIIAAIATQNQLLTLKKAISAMESLAEGDGRITLFDGQASAEGSGNYQLGAVQKSDNGSLSMALGAFHCRLVDTRRRFLFFSWASERVNLWTAAQKMTLNRDFYGLVRERVHSKLVGATKFLAELRIV